LTAARRATAASSRRAALALVIRPYAAARARQENIRSSGQNRDPSRDDLDGLREAPPELQHLDRRDLSALDHAVGAGQVAVYEEGEPGDALRDADPVAA